MSFMPVEIHPLAQEDVNQALIYVAVDNPQAAESLLNGILAALQRASEHPYSAPQISIGGRKPRTYHRLYVHPYCIYYRIIQERIVVMRVLHERMDERKRL